MGTLKMIVIAVAAVLATILVFSLIGMAFSLLKYLFWIAVICVIVALLWKMFGSRDRAEVSGDDPQNKLQNAEMTLEEYKQKLESQLKEPRSGKEA
jgi:Na+/melibiose symporter-like transporter